MTLFSGSAGVTGAVLVGTDSDFIAGWVTNSSVEVRHVALSGALTGLLSEAGVTSGQLALDARGPRWAVGWINGGTKKMYCLDENLDAGAEVALADGGELDTLSVAINGAGAVAVAGVSTTKQFWGGHSTPGCPTVLRQLTSASVSANGGSVVATGEPSGDGFRYVQTGQFNAYNGGMVLMALIDGGITSQYTGVAFHAPQSHSAVASDDGGSVIVAFSEIETNDSYTIGLITSSAALIDDGSPIVTNQSDPAWWAVSACGPGRAGLTSLTYGSTAPAAVTFYSDEPSAQLLGAYDAICNLPPQMISGSSIAIGYAQNRIGVLLTTSSAVRLYLCDPPPP